MIDKWRVTSRLIKIITKLFGYNKIEFGFICNFEIHYLAMKIHYKMADAEHHHFVTLPYKPQFFAVTWTAIICGVRS